MRLDPRTLLRAYGQGIFPMADEEGRIRWYSADPRGVLPLDALHVPHSLAQIIRQGRFEIRINTCFEAVMQGCMQTRSPVTWINPELIAAYVRLHQQGHAHSVEAFEKGELAGGLYGVTLGGAFFGESMFHHRRDASKVALVALVQRLNERGYRLLDTQTWSPHLARFGGIPIPSREYMRRLRKALRIECAFA